MESLLKWALHEYKGDDDLDRIFNSLWEVKENLHGCMPTLIPEEKSEKRAEELRLEGNLYYKSRDFEQALSLYNISILFAPHPVLDNEDLSVCTKFDEDESFAFPLIDPARYGGIEGESTSLAKAYSNRSALLFEIGFYKDCLDDIALALEYGIPRELIPKLEQRRDRCQKNMTKSKRSGESHTDHEPKKDHNLEWNEVCNLVIKNMTDKFSISQVPKSVHLKERLSFKAQHLPNLQNPNPCIPSLSSAVKISMRDYSGRSVTAVRDIRPGEVLGSERAYSMGIGGSHVSTFCATCGVFCLTPIPCPKCTKVIYCSRSCRTRGLAEDHWYDCKILPFLIALGFGSWACSYKLFKTFSFQQIKTMNKELLRQKVNGPKILGFNKKGIYSSSSYEAIYHLCHHSPKNDSLSFMQEGALAFCIAEFLRESGRFFVNEIGEQVSVTKEDIFDAFKALWFNITRKNTNSFGQFGGIKCSLEDQGFLVFSGISLVNHSCNPSAVMVHDGRRGILVALRPIAAGEEITLSYTAPFYVEEMSLRKKYLENYNIECKCEACEGRWPILSELLKLKSSRFKCFNCFAEANLNEFICSKCMCMLSFDNAQKLIQDKLMKWSQVDMNVGRLFKKLHQGGSMTKHDVRFILDASVMVHNLSVMPSLLNVFLMFLTEISVKSNSLWAS